MLEAKGRATPSKQEQSFSPAVHVRISAQAQGLGARSGLWELGKHICVQPFLVLSWMP